ncbi:LPS export ABC transporter permease LptF [Porticoccaceae bacterium LTM1]|nr:LPS export ABC transporter permease LptF [Porticoccaceae bacterium LTM1]
MIIFRYLFRQLFSTTIAVCSVLLLVFLSARFVKYLSEVVSGKWEAGVLFAFIGYRLPGFLELLLPLSFFISILLAYGRLYLDSEMTVLNACGMSQKRLLGYTLLSSVLIIVAVSWLALLITPAGQEKFNQLEVAQQQRGELSSFPAKQFYSFSKGGVAYAEEVKDSRLYDVFHTSSESNGSDSTDSQVIVVANAGHQERSEDRRNNYLVLEDGYRIEGQPGRADFRITHFGEFGTELARTQLWRGQKRDGSEMPTAELWGSDKPDQIAALHWRLSMPLLVIVVTMLAVPLSKTSPRQGRYLKLLPAVAIYLVYMLVLKSGQGKVVDGELSPYMGVWGVHALFLVVSLLFFVWPTVRLKLLGGRSR